MKVSNMPLFTPSGELLDMAAGTPPRLVEVPGGGALEVWTVTVWSSPAKGEYFCVVGSPGDADLVEHELAELAR